MGVRVESFPILLCGIAIVLVTEFQRRDLTLQIINLRYTCRYVEL